jgi:thiol-disulfide isomerase/thioredoxin
MKKGILVGVGIVALLALMWWVDKKFPAREAPAVSETSTPSEGTPAPNVTMKDIDGHDVTLGQYKGKVVLVNFWATWCEPCRTEIPWMIEFQQKFAPRGFTILGVSMDEDGKKAVEPFLEKQRFDVNGQQEAMNYPILLGNDNISNQFGGIMGLPTSMLYSRDGKRMRTIIGLINHDEIQKAIEGLL